MKQPGELAVLRQPEYYKVANVVSIPTSSLDIRPRSLGDVVYLVMITDGDLSDPGSEPIGVFGDGSGNRQYQWREAYWSEADALLLTPIAHTMPEWFTVAGPVTPSSRVVLLYRLGIGGRHRDGAKI